MTDALIQLARQAQLARREQRPADARLHWLEAVALCRDAGLRPELVQALKGVAQIERDEGRGEAALPLYEEALAICREGLDELMLAHTVRHLGDLHQDAGRLESAAPCFEEALAIYRGDGRASPVDRFDLAGPSGSASTGICGKGFAYPQRGSTRASTAELSRGSLPRL